MTHIAFDRRNTSKEGMGFTIIELLVALTIGSILLAIAVPSFRAMAANNRLTTQSNELITALNLGRSEAVKRNGNVTVCSTDSATANDCVTAASWQFWLVKSASGTIVRRGYINTYGGTLKVSSTLTSNEVVFGSDGLARTGGSLVNDHTLKVCATNIASKNTRSIVMGGGGRVYIKLEQSSC